MLELGRFNTLRVLRETSVGLFLGDEDGNDVLLPKKYIPENTKIDDQIDVFLYTDSEDRIIATTLVPDVQLHQFEMLKCVSTNSYGAFLAWGLEKDLFVPFQEQREKMREGESYLIYVYLDDQSERLMASSKLKKFLSNDYLTVKEMEEVDLIILDKTDLGYNVAVNSVHSGLIYENELFQKIEYGQRIKGFVSRIREDKKVDIRLQRSGLRAIEGATDVVINALGDANGFLPYHDKSSAEEIYAAFNMSKKQFKKAVGNLYKQELISIEENGIRLAPPKV